MRLRTHAGTLVSNQATDAKFRWVVCRVCHCVTVSRKVRDSKLEMLPAQREHVEYEGEELTNALRGPVFEYRGK